MKIELLEKIKDRITVEPHRFDMGLYFSDDSNLCGTTACIAGWAIILAKPDAANGDHDPLSLWEQEAGREVLGISEVQASRLFYECSWPKQFKLSGLTMYQASDAKIACARIDHFIATNGEE